MSIDNGTGRAPDEVAAEAGGGVDFGESGPRAGRRDRSGGKRVARGSDGLHNAVQHGVYGADAYSTRAYLQTLASMFVLIIGATSSEKAETGRTRGYAQRRPDGLLRETKAPKRYDKETRPYRKSHD